MRFTRKPNREFYVLEKKAKFEGDEIKIKCSINYMLFQIMKYYPDGPFILKDLDTEFMVSNGCIKINKSSDFESIETRPQTFIARNPYDSELSCMIPSFLQKMKTLQSHWTSITIFSEIWVNYAIPDVRRAMIIKLLDQFCEKLQLSIEVFQYTVLLWETIRKLVDANYDADVARKFIFGCLYQAIIVLKSQSISKSDMVEKCELDSIKELDEILMEIDAFRPSSSEPLPVPSDFLKYLKWIDQDDNVYELSLIYCRRMVYVSMICDLSSSTIAAASYLAALIDLRKFNRWSLTHSFWMDVWDLKEIRGLLLSLHVLYKYNLDLSSDPDFLEFRM